MDKPNFRYERKLWKSGYGLVAGVDEVGRGCFAGPLVASAVVFSPISNFFNQAPIINDSKKLTTRQREKASKWIQKNAYAWGIGKASVPEINRLGMTKATNLAFRRAIMDSGAIIEYLLIDAFYIPFVRGIRRKNQKAITKGDTKSISIASASIIAKVYRDKLMVSLNELTAFKSYNWAKNKGYGTKEHREAILKYGICKYHRKKFIETWSSKGNLQITSF